MCVGIEPLTTIILQQTRIFIVFHWSSALISEMFILLVSAKRINELNIHGSWKDF